MEIILLIIPVTALMLCVLQYCLVKMGIRLLAFVMPGFNIAYSLFTQVSFYTEPNPAPLSYRLTLFTIQNIFTAVLIAIYFYFRPKKTAGSYRKADLNEHTK